jgi:hypothetical protein
VAIAGDITSRAHASPTAPSVIGRTRIVVKTRCHALLRRMPKAIGSARPTLNGDFENVHRCGILAAQSRAGQDKYLDVENAAADYSL